MSEVVYLREIKEKSEEENPFQDEDEYKSKQNKMKKKREDNNRKVKQMLGIGRKRK